MSTSVGASAEASLVEHRDERRAAAVLFAKLCDPGREPSPLAGRVGGAAGVLENRDGLGVNPPGRSRATSHPRRACTGAAPPPVAAPRGLRRGTGADVTPGPSRDPRAQRSRLPRRLPPPAAPRRAHQGRARAGLPPRAPPPTARAARRPHGGPRRRPRSPWSISGERLHTTSPRSPLLATAFARHPAIPRTPARTATRHAVPVDRRVDPDPNGFECSKIHLVTNVWVGLLSAWPRSSWIIRIGWPSPVGPQSDPPPPGPKQKHRTCRPFVEG
jgi:hypothetical protein